MKCAYWLALALLAALGVATPSPSGHAEAPATKPQAEAESRPIERGSAQAPAAPAPLPVFVPPQTGRPVVRLRSASARGPDGPRPVVSALAPERVGFTVAAQPELYWHLDRLPGPGAVAVFALTSEGRDQPVAEFSLPMPEAPGIFRVALAEHGVALERGTAYEWSVALVVDPDRWSQNVFAIAGIERIETPDAVVDQLALAHDPAENVYAEAGFWYDAFAAAAGTRERTALLQQVGLGDLEPAR